MNALKFAYGGLSEPDSYLCQQAGVAAPDASAEVEGERGRNAGGSPGSLSPHAVAP
jgi:hypothetical protein